MISSLMSYQYFLTKKKQHSVDTLIFDFCLSQGKSYDSSIQCLNFKANSCEIRTNIIFELHFQKKQSTKYASTPYNLHITYKQLTVCYLQKKRTLTNSFGLH